ncbi:MAG: hypothetical protein Q9216_005210 [Gyalolechia sp. 2 TL-2023]
MAPDVDMTNGNELVPNVSAMGHDGSKPNSQLDPIAIIGMVAKIRREIDHYRENCICPLQIPLRYAARMVAE